MFFKKLEPRKMATFWLVIGIFSLTLSGAFAFLSAISRLPWLAGFFTDADFFKRVLVVHVDLGVAVWFTAIPVVFFYLVNEGSSLGFCSKISASLAAAGICLMVIGGFMKSGAPYLSNYIPVISHPLFLVGLTYYFLGVGLNYLNKGLFVSNGKHQWPELQFGVRIGALYYLLSVILILVSTMKIPKGFSGVNHFEILMWGPGHVLQFANVVFLIVALHLIQKSLDPDFNFSRIKLFLIFAWLAVPLWLSPLIAYSDLVSERYRNGFTLLMRWGLFQPVVYYLVTSWPQIKKDLRDFRFLVFLFSGILVSLGFVFGALVRGPDLRLPGHYHASIGAVTLSFMGACLVVLKHWGFITEEFIQQKKSRTFVWLYGIGQIVFSTGMFIAGTFGMSRKTYGVEQHIRNTGQTVGMSIMGVGGMLALAGGIAFIIVVWPALIRALKFGKTKQRMDDPLEVGSHGVIV